MNTHDILQTMNALSGILMILIGSSWLKVYLKRFLYF